MSRVGGLREVLRIGPFRRLMGAQVASQMADGLYQIALAAVLIFDVSAAKTPGQTTKVLAVTLLPFSIVGPFTGPFIDRFSRRSILVGTSIARAILTALLVPALVWPEWSLLLISVAVMSINRFFHATKTTVLPTLVPRHRYLTANSATAIAGMVFGLLGAVIGGPLADFVSKQAVVIAAAGLMALAAVIAFTIPLPPGERKGLAGIVRELRDTGRDVAAGVRTLRGSRASLQAIAGVWTLRGLVGFLLLAGIVLLRTRFDLRASGASLLLGGIAVGGFVGAMVVSPLARRIGTRRVPVAAFLTAGTVTVALGAIPAWPALLVTVFVGGVGMAATKIAAETTIQREIPDHFRGRAFTVYDIGYNGVFVLAALIPTFLVGSIGEVGIIFLAGGLALAAGALFSRSPSPERIEVHAYAGARGDETPRAVIVHGEAVSVEKVERSWQEDRAGERLLVFRLLLEDGSRVQVARDAEGWRLDR